jgi:hypothetical protein
MLIVRQAFGKGKIGIADLSLGKQCFNDLLSMKRLLERGIKLSLSIN